MTTRYRITPDRLQLRKGLFRRTTIDVRRDRIRTVDVTAHVLHRMLGPVEGRHRHRHVRSARAPAGSNWTGSTSTTPQALRAELLHRVAAGPTGADRRAGRDP